MIVVDASAFVASVMEDEFDERTKQFCDLVIENDELAVVPALFYYEAANVLLKSLRRKRIEKIQYQNHLKLLLAFPLIVDEETPVFEIALLAEKYELSFYDATYLELAKRQNCSLVTLDNKLAVAAKKASIELAIQL